jgi:hypothetical protein
VIDRATLHQLIDALPDERLENLERVLQYEGLAPGAVGRIPEATAGKIRQGLEHTRMAPDDWNTLRERMRQGIERRVERWRISGVVQPTLIQPDGSHSSTQGFDKDGALVVLTFRYFKGHKIETAERISFSPETHSLTYSQDVTGPDGGHTHHDAQFFASAA